MKLLMLWLRTVRYLTLAQGWHRCRFAVRRRWWRLVGSRAPLPVAWHLTGCHFLLVGLHDVDQLGPWRDDAGVARRRACAVSKRHFTFLNHSMRYNEGLGWHDQSVSRLWRYQLHCFDYAQDLLVWAYAGGLQSAYGAFRDLVASWVRENRVLVGDGWHPYTLSLRLVNWLQTAAAFEEQLSRDQSFRRSLYGSLYGQARYLASNLEQDVRGNHLLANLAALVWAGVAFDGAEPRRWLRQALDRLHEELAEQILPDGGHLERSPGYHLTVLKHCLEIALLLRRNDSTCFRWLDDALGRMLDHLLATLPPDHRVLLLKDTARDAAPRPLDLLAAGALYFGDPTYKLDEGFGLYPLLLFGQAGWDRYRKWPVNDSHGRSLVPGPSGLAVLRDDRRGEHLVMDVGKPCPDYLPAHAHADLLSYELALGHQQIVVDSGVYEYAAGAWRDYFRSTRAHNTVEVAGENQSEVWSSFRVARRARPGRTTWQEGDGYILIQSEHDGYSRLVARVTHRRTVVWWPNRYYLIIDQLIGRGHAASASYVHLHPELTLSRSSACTWRVCDCEDAVWISAFGHSGHVIVRGQTKPCLQGWYSERFGELMPNTVLTLYGPSALPVCYGYAISLHEPADLQVVAEAGEWRIASRAGSCSHTFRLGGDGLAELS